MQGLIEWLKNHLLTCPSKYFFHIDCPGCGLQRSFVALVEGDLVKSLQLYPATIPILFCFIFTAMHLVFKYKYGPEIIKSAFVFTSLVIVISYFYKIVSL